MFKEVCYKIFLLRLNQMLFLMSRLILTLTEQVPDDQNTHRYLKI